MDYCSSACTVGWALKMFVCQSWDQSELKTSRISTPDILSPPHSNQNKTFMQTAKMPESGAVLAQRQRTCADFSSKLFSPFEINLKPQTLETFFHFHYCQVVQSCTKRKENIMPTVGFEPTKCMCTVEPKSTPFDHTRASWHRSRRQTRYLKQIPIVSSCPQRPFWESVPPSFPEMS